MLNGAPNGSLGLATPSGWMNCELFVVVLKHFIKHMNVFQNNPAIIVMDNHESHVTLQTIDTVREHGLIILSFPPHCSHRMQPLDVSIYGPFKRYFDTACNDWMMTNPGRALTIYDIGALSGQAYDRAFIPANVTADFKRTGIYPVNRNGFTDDLFLPSVPTDREEVPVRHMKRSVSVRKPTKRKLNQTLHLYHDMLEHHNRRRQLQRQHLSLPKVYGHILEQLLERRGCDGATGAGSISG